MMTFERFLLKRIEEYETIIQELLNDMEEKKTYEKGLADAWEAVKKICLPAKIGGMMPHTLMEIFGTPSTCEIITKYTAAEVVTKIKAYKGKQQKIEQEIKIGDEVIENDDTSKRGVVTYLTGNGNLYNVLWDDGLSCRYYEKEIKKTGRHFPEIKELLKAMKEEE